MKVLSKTLSSLVVATATITTSHADSFSNVRSYEGSGFQSMVCEGGGGFRSCELSYTLAISSNPTTLAATNDLATIYVTVTDYYKNPVKNQLVNWSTTNGWLNTTQSTTDVNGVAIVQLTSSRNIGGATITAKADQDDGAGSLYIPFTDKWASAASLYSAWQDSGSPYNCSTWEPDPATVNQGLSFTQTSSCSQNQVMYRQDREVSLVTGAYRNVGAVVPSYQTVPAGRSQGAVGTKVSTGCLPFVDVRTACSGEKSCAQYYRYGQNVWSNMYSNGATRIFKDGEWLYGTVENPYPNKISVFRKDGLIYYPGPTKIVNWPGSGKNQMMAYDAYELCYRPE